MSTGYDRHDFVTGGDHGPGSAWALPGAVILGLVLLLIML
jgi:hypothetical protein